MQYRTAKAALARNSLRVAQVQLKVGRIRGETVELNVTGRVGRESRAGCPEGRAFDGNAAFVEESHPIINVKITIDRRADGDGHVKQSIFPLGNRRRNRSLVSQ